MDYRQKPLACIFSAVLYMGIGDLVKCFFKIQVYHIYRPAIIKLSYTSLKKTRSTKIQYNTTLQICMARSPIGESTLTIVYHTVHVSRQVLRHIILVNPPHYYAFQIGTTLAFIQSLVFPPLASISS